MRKYIALILCTCFAFCNTISYAQHTTLVASPQKTDTKFVWQTEQFADLGIVRYVVDGWDNLTLNQKLLVYYLSEAGYSGRDIIYDQNYRLNIPIRKTLERIVEMYQGNKETTNWQNFMVYTKRIWFSNGIYHHYSSDKIMPAFSEEYFRELMKSTDTEVDEEMIKIMFDPTIDAKKVSLDPAQDLLLSSAVNFYAPDVAQQEAEDFYIKMRKPGDEKPVAYGLNSQLIKTPNGLEERVWKVNGMYGDAIKEIVKWLKLAVTVAENKPQADALKLLIKYYETGDLKTWDEYNIAWVKATEGDIDYINSFIEVYNDPLGYRGSYESIVEIKDFDASERMAKLSEHAQWFEDNSTIMPEHKRLDVVGVTYKVVNVASESGDASPSTAIGVNLPNSDWIREDFGSKSVSLGNIVSAYENAGGPGLTSEFCLSEEEKKRADQYGSFGSKMHTAMHEVIGHASGKINPGIGSPKETLKNYANTLEEGRADLVALYYIMDPKLVEWGLLPSLDVGRAQYENYIRNGLMIQLRRLEPGKDVEESHMRNRQMIAAWVYEKGKAENVIEKKVVDGKTYFVINDYEKLRNLFGVLLKEIQRIKSEGDYEAGKTLVETYGVKVDQQIHAEVLKRVEHLNLPAYMGFINPQFEVVKDTGGHITDIRITYPDDFTTQMLYYGKNYSFLNVK